MIENNKHNDLQEILTQALNELKNELGEKFDINKVNLAELERRTGITRGKLRALKANNFEVKPHGLTGKASNNASKISGFTGTINGLLSKGIVNSSVIFDRISENGYKLHAENDYSVTAVEDFTPPTQWTPGTTVEKKVSAVNTGNIDAFVKATITGDIVLTRNAGVTVDMNTNLTEDGTSFEPTEPGYYIFARSTEEISYLILN